jgi:hypothetical protein
MRSVDLPELLERPVALTLEERALRSTGRSDQGTDPEVTLERRVSVGGPVAVPVTPGYVADDRDLRAFVEQEARRARYHLVHFAMTFEPCGSGDPALEAASIEIVLSSHDSAVDPIAWSMLPLRVLDPFQVTQSAKLGPELKFLGVEATAGSVEGSRTQQHAEVFLEGLRVLRADPAWQFERTRSFSLSGSHRLMMVVRAGRGATVRGNITVRASIRQRRIFSYRADLPDPLQLSFDF